MEISVERFGPIESGSVPIKPLTVFIGPNNSGKSFLAMLAYAACMAVPPFQTDQGPPPSPAAIGFMRSVLSRPAPEAVLDEIEEKVLRPGVGTQMNQISASSLDWLTNDVTNALREYAVALVKEVERCFGSRLSQLRRRNGDTEVTTIRVRSDHPAWCIRIDLTKSGRQFIVEKSPELPAILARIADGTELADPWEWRASSRASELRHRILEACFAELPRARYYLPAARSGVLHSHRLLASIMVSRAPLAGIETVAVPRMTGVIADFIGLLLQLDPGDRRGSLDPVARIVESDILAGEIEIRGRPPAYPEITYSVKDHRYQLHQTSSLVSDLAPVVLFLRYMVDGRELLIVEEPEAHLHPESQLRFARALARVVNAGVTTILATHSELFLTQISNSIRASAVAAQTQGQVDFAREEMIAPETVGAYLFRRTKAGGGTKIRSIPVTRRKGISDEEFGGIVETLYNETVLLQRHFMRDEG